MRNKKLHQERNEKLQKARKESEVKLVADRRIDLVISKHRYAMNLDYEKANIVIALNPEMPTMKKTSEVKFKLANENYEKSTNQNIKSASQQVVLLFLLLFLE
ncbi:MAG: hypothetical protein J7L26_07555 [Candidatus Aminicenantes bacterium]|nr:hypothetical protein [Candidatus Aminicenantes bacterium]